MSLTRFALRNPLVIGAITLALAIFGLYSYFSMGIGVVPNISFPGVTIITTDAGADPATIETQITKPIEDAVATLANIDQIVSFSNEGISSVTVQFTTAANTELVPVDVERVVNSVRSKLPADADPPSISKFETSQIPVIVVTLSGPQPLDQTAQVATDRIQRAFEAVHGVASVAVQGGPTREVQVKVDTDKLQARGLGLNTVQLALNSEQIEVPAGSLTSASKDVNVRFTGLVKTPAQLGQIIVAPAAANGQGPVYLKDIATVDDTIKKTQSLSRIDGTPAVALTVTKLASASSLKVSADIRKVMAQLEPTLPQGMKFDVGYDIALYTQQSFNTIQKTLLEAVLFTGLILLLFLHTWRSTLIVLISIPTSVLTTFGFMNLLGMNLNLFSMLALTLSVGILVDDSIVVLENIYRHMGLGDPPWVAAINGRSEIGLAAITITSVDVAVYLPIALMPGISGEFIRPFALVVASATLTSLAVSFTLTPLLASRYLRLEHALSHGGGWFSRFGRRWDAGFERVGQLYQSVLRKVLTERILTVIPRRKGKRGVGARWLVIGVGLLSLVVGLGTLATGRVGFDIFPSGDQSEVDLTITMPPATTLAQTDAAVRELERRLRTYPEVSHIISNVGASTGQTISLQPKSDTALVRVLLFSPRQRKRSAAQLADDMDANLSRGIPGIKVRTGLQNAFGFGGFGTQPIQVAVRGPNPDVLNGLVNQVTTAVKSVPGATDVNNVNENVQPEFVINVDRDKAADVGVTAQQAAGALRTAVDGTLLTTKFRRPGQDDIDIRIIAADSFRATPDNLATLPLLSSKGTIVSLGQVGTITAGTAPTEIDHVDRDRSVIVNASATGRLVGDVQRDVETNVAKIRLPPGYTVKYYGQAQQGGQAFGDIYKAVAIGLALIYMLMMMLFGSVTLPLAVMMSLPLAVVGSFSAMAITATAFTLFSLLGFTLLVGLVGKNAILLVDFTDTLRRRGETRLDALLHAGPTRLRPIVMTTMSIIVALSPVAAGIEEGSELLKAAAIVLIGGLFTSTLLTLVFVPAMYTIFDDVQEFILRGVRRVSPPRALEPAELAIAHPNGRSAIKEPSPAAAGEGRERVPTPSPEIDREASA